MPDATTGSCTLPEAKDQSSIPGISSRKQIEGSLGSNRASGRKGVQFQAQYKSRLSEVWGGCRLNRENKSRALQEKNNWEYRMSGSRDIEVGNRRKRATQEVEEVF
jgi:hypothetical protein